MSHALASLVNWVGTFYASTLRRALEKATRNDRFFTGRGGGLLKENID
jgi:hypothetical protein